MNKRVFLIGLAGGLLVSAALYYPLYNYLPSAFVEGWPTADVRTAMLWTTLAAVLLLATGIIAARSSGTRNRFAAAGAGAAAGVTAALLAELFLGGSAAGVWGSRLMLAHGVHATKDEAEFITLLTHGVTSTIWWVYASIWMATAAGLLLGALGGLAAGPGGKPARPAPELWLVVSGTGILASALSLATMTAVYQLLGPITQRAADTASVSLPYPSESILNWPVITNLAWLVFWQLTGWLVLRRYPANRNSWFLFKTVLILFGGMALSYPLMLYTPLFAASLTEAPGSAHWAGLPTLGLGLVLLLTTMTQPHGSTPSQSRLLQAWKQGWNFLQQLGDARRAAVFYLAIALLLPLSLFLTFREILFMPWCAGGLALGILFAILGLRDAWKASPNMDETSFGMSPLELFPITSLGGLFPIFLTMLNCLAPLSVVLISIVMIAVLMLHSEAEVAAQAGLQSLASIVQLNYRIAVYFSQFLGVALLIVTTLATAVRLIWKKFRPRLDQNNPSTQSETK